MLRDDADDPDCVVLDGALRSFPRMDPLPLRFVADDGAPHWEPA